MSKLCEARESFILSAVFSLGSCADGWAQFTIRNQEYVLQKKIATLKQLMSDQNLQLLPDYEQRVSVLKELGFIDDNLNVELKGRVACEVRVFFLLLGMDT